MLARSVFITGCNRGLGYELVKQLAESSCPPKHIFACCRNPEKAQDLLNLESSHSTLKVFQLDVSDEKRFKDLKEEIHKLVGDKGLNLLINNAGVAPKSTRINYVSWAQMTETLNINVTAPVMLTKTFLPLLKDAALCHDVADEAMSVQRAAVVNLSSVLGSLAENKEGGLYPYRASKAALNAVTKSLSVDLKPSNILVTSLHPGWVKTDMGGPHAPLTPKDSISSIINTLRKLSLEHHGKFVQFDGSFLPW